jgi:DNA-binding NtrC family response regulator
MSKKRLLLVDDHDGVRAVFQEGMQACGFEVVGSASVNEALRLIATEKFNVLLSDLHMPDAGDGFTVVSAMVDAHPNAVTLVLSGYPALQEALASILLEADEVLVRPVGLAPIAEIIENKLSNPSARTSMRIARVAEILERDTEPTIRD